MRKVILLILTLVFLSTSIILSQERRDKKIVPKIGNIIKRLNLTEEQQKKLQEIRREFMKQKIMKESELKVARIELEELIDKEEVNEKVIYDKVNQIGKLETDMLKIRVEQVLKIKKILTKEQQQKVRELMFFLKEPPHEEKQLPPKQFKER